MLVIGGNKMGPSRKGRGGEAFDKMMEKTRYMAAAYGIPCIDGAELDGNMQLTGRGRMRSNASASSTV